mmetsp:Transcript_68/g.180  ORF Transcript_68/g.180 Transcript_68/m.180 type:complete len:248 (-) Transcript_68:1034-1777(-)
MAGGHNRCQLGSARMSSAASECCRPRGRCPRNSQGLLHRMVPHRRCPCSIQARVVACLPALLRAACPPALRRTASLRHSLEITTQGAKTVEMLQHLLATSGLATTFQFKDGTVEARALLRPMTQQVCHLGRPCRRACLTNRPAPCPRSLQQHRSRRRPLETASLEQARRQLVGRVLSAGRKHISTWSKRSGNYKTSFVGRPRRRMIWHVRLSPCESRYEKSRNIAERRPPSLRSSSRDSNATTSSCR